MEPAAGFFHGQWGGGVFANSFFLDLAIIVILEFFLCSLAQKLYINDDSNRNSNTLPSQPSVVASPASLPGKSNIYGIGLD